MAVARERSRLILLKAIPRGNPTPLENAVIDISPVITIDVIRAVSTIPVIVLNHFIFLAICSRTSISLRKNMPQFLIICLSDVFVVLVVLQGLNLDKFWFHYRYTHCLFNSCKQNVIGITSLLFSSSILKSRCWCMSSNPKKTKWTGEKLAL